jgi:hypothetical protein
VRDLLVITPTRGRLAGAQRLIDAVAATATAGTDLVLGIDDDDPSYARLDLAGRRVAVDRGPRANCAEWTNRMAARHARGYRYLASLSDDHLPETPGWDSQLIAAIEDIGGTGIAYGNDMLQGEALPTAPVMSADIVHALGWMFCPPMSRLFCDNAWKDLGQAAGCLAYRPDVIIRHLHYSAGLAPRDQTAIDGEGAWAHDEAAYHDWRRDRMAADTLVIRKLRESRADRP